MPVPARARQLLTTRRRATVAGVMHLFLMSGNGRTAGDHVEGGGSFNQLKVVDAIIPRPLVATGTWRATRLTSFNALGTYGVFRAGILTMDVELNSQVPSESRASATLEVVCNIAPVPRLFNPGKDEGFYLTASGVTFEPFGVEITLFPASTEQGD